MEDTVEEEGQENENNRLYFRGRPLRTTGKMRSRYESSDDQIPIDYSRPLGENIREALSCSLSSSIEEGGSSKQIRLNHLNNLVRLIEKYYHKQQRHCADVGQQRSTICKDSNAGGSWMTFEQILTCVRCLLTDDEREIRAAALRVLRYLIQSAEELKIALRLHLDLLIARCVDVVLDNRLERTQCMRLLISLIYHCPSAFPSSLVQVLLAVCLDGQEENDKLARSATAALCELTILNPDLVLTCGGVGWLIRSILISGQSTTRLAECLTTVLASVYNQRKNRQNFAGVLKNVFYDLLAPLMDEHFKLSGADKEEKSVQLKAEAEQVLDNCRSALVAALRTWPGLIGCFSPSPGQGLDGAFLQAPIYALVVSLCLDSDKIRDFAVEAICEILNVPYQTEHWDNWEKTLDVADCVPLEEYKYSLTQQFTNADACSLLGDWNKRRRPNLTTQTTALILLGLVDAGLGNALARIIVKNPNRALELKMTLVLSDMLEMCGRLLPSIYRQLTLSMAWVLQSIYDESIYQEEDNVLPKLSIDARSAQSTTPREVQRQNAILLAHRLRTLSALRQRSKQIRTLQMENLLSKFCYNNKNGFNDALRNAELESSGGVADKTMPRVHTLRASQALVSRSASLPVDARPLVAKLVADRVHELIRDSRSTVPYSNHTAWDWSLIYLALCQMCEHRQHFDDSSCSKFTSQLIQFYDPVGGQFCKLADDYRSYSRVGCALMRVLGGAGWDSAMGVQLRTFLSHLVANLLPDRLHVGQLSTKNILNGSCADYFVFIGQLSDTDIGRLALERTGIMQRLVDLINNETHDSYIKLIVSSMIDYDRPGMGRVLLQKALTSTKESARLYSTTFLSTLGKLKVQNFADWGVEMLINQLRDGCRAVVEEAARILEELINDEEYLNSLIRLRPSLLPLGDAGILLLTYVMSNEQAVSAMIKLNPSQQKRNSLIDDEKNQNLRPPSSTSLHFVGNEIERWKSVFNEKYSRIVDERLCEAFSSFRRMADGSFPRHASRNLQSTSDVFVPPHLYGQLARHSTGCQLLQTFGCLPPLLDVLHTRMLATDNDVLVMKSAMWALSHVASTELGYNLLPPDIVACLVKLAEECPVLTVRGCAFYALNLVAQSGPAARERLRQLAWEATSTTPSLTAFYHRRRVDEAQSSSTSTRIRHDHSRRHSFEEEEIDTQQVNFLSASVTSGGDILSSGSGSSPPRPVSPSIAFLMTSPNASRKSSSQQQQQQQQTRRYRSHYSSSDAHSVLTCASCELCRRPSSSNNWIGVNCAVVGGSTRGGTGDSFSSLASPVRVSCCEPSSPVSSQRTLVNGPNETEGLGEVDEGRRQVRSKSLGTTEQGGVNIDAPTLVLNNYLTTDTISGSRKISVPTISTIDTANRNKSIVTVDAFIGEEESIDQFLIGDRSRSIDRSAIDCNGGFFARIAKRSDSVSESLRSALGLTKMPLLPEDLPMIRVSFRKSWEEYGDDERIKSEYITDENAAGFATWRLLQKQQRERAMSFDAGVPSMATIDIGALGGSRATSRLEWSEDLATPIDEEQGRSVADASFPGDQSPSLQRMKLYAAGDNDGGILSGFGSEKPVFTCLPLDIGLVCNVTDWPSESEIISKPRLAAHESPPPPPNYPGRHHVLDRCLHCRSFVTEEALINSSLLIDDQRRRNSASVVESEDAAAAAAGGDGKRKQSVVQAQEQNLNDLLTKEQRQQGAAAFRKELLRLVTLLSVRKKYAEQGLLRLKQEAPQLFRSLCLYCDVSFIMSSYTFRLSARRFLQELFQDVDFSELWTEPRRLLFSGHHYHHHRLSPTPAPE